MVLFFVYYYLVGYWIDGVYLPFLWMLYWSKCWWVVGYLLMLDGCVGNLAIGLLLGFIVYWPGYCKLSVYYLCLLSSFIVLDGCMGLLVCYIVLLDLLEVSLRLRVWLVGVCWVLWFTWLSVFVIGGVLLLLIGGCLFVWACVCLFNCLVLFVILKVWL